MSKKNVVLKVVLVILLTMLFSGCVEKGDHLGKDMLRLTISDQLEPLSATEVVHLLKGKKISGESVKSRQMNCLFTQKFNADGSWSYTFLKRVTLEPAHFVVGKWWVKDDGSLCTQKEYDDQIHCNKKIYRTESSYFTVNTQSGKVWSEWTFAR